MPPGASTSSTQPSVVQTSPCPTSGSARCDRLPVEVNDFHRLGAHELLAGYAAGGFSPVEVVEALAARIEATEPVLNAFFTPTPVSAIAAARVAEERWREGRARPLEGVPFGVKDLFDTAGIRTTYGSPMFDRHVPDRDARAVERMQDSGAILLGKTATDEFAYGIAGVNPHYGPARNPWNPERVSGGSSSGSGVAVGAGYVPLALGSDTGGSIRSPSSFCGIVGFKGTWGAISTDGMWAMGRSLDHRRPDGEVADRRRAHAPGPVEGSRGREIARSLASGLAPLPAEARLGVCPDLEQIPLDADVRTVFDGAVASFACAGYTPREARFRQAPEVQSTFVPIRDAETLYTHRAAGLFPARRGVQRADVLPARNGRERRPGRVPRRLHEPVAARRGLRRPVRRGRRAARAARDRPAAADRRRRAGSTGVERSGPPHDPENLLALPACAVRAGFDNAGLPVGVQLVGAPGADALVLAAAQTFFEATAAVQDQWPDL